MDSLPLEIIHSIASVDMDTYHALMTAYSRYSRSIAAVPTVGRVDRFDMMIEFGYDVRVVRSNYTHIKWTRYGIVHGCGMPAVIYEDGMLIWYKWGQIHRDEDLPSVVCDDFLNWYRCSDHTSNIHPKCRKHGQSVAYYRHGFLHRDGGLPAVINADNTQIWYQNGKIHRENDQPAIIHPDGMREWFYEGKWHRDNGPALLSTDGWMCFYTHGVEYRQQRASLL